MAPNDQAPKQPWQLEPDQLKAIAAEFAKEFSGSPHWRVARRLRSAGFTENHIHRFRQSAFGYLIFEDQYLGVLNAMSNLEKGLNEPK